MSDENPTTDTAPVTQAVQVTQPATETFSLDYVQGLRQEAAKYRTEKNDAVEKAKGEVIKDYEGQLTAKEASLNSLQAEFNTASLQLLKMQAVLEAEIPVEDVLDVVALVQGEDEKTVTESVKRVKSLLGKAPAKERPVDPSQGSGNHLPLNGDPLLETVRRIVGA
jgi:hypothetical protein